jgi:hypothetical protein
MAGGGANRQAKMLRAKQKAKPGWLARLFSFITLWGLTWF